MIFGHVLWQKSLLPNVVPLLAGDRPIKKKKEEPVFRVALLQYLKEVKSVFYK